MDDVLKDDINYVVYNGYTYINITKSPIYCGIDGSKKSIMIPPSGTVIEVPYLQRMFSFFDRGGYAMIINPKAKEWLEERSYSDTIILGKKDVAILYPGLVYGISSD